MKHYIALTAVALGLTCSTVSATGPAAQGHGRVNPAHQRVVARAESAHTSNRPSVRPGFQGDAAAARATDATVTTKASNTAADTVATPKPRVAAATSTAAGAGAAVAGAASSPLPLIEYTFAYDQIPYKVMPQVIASDPSYRGPQAGYNICNSTTAGPTSECQTLIVNSLSDMCLWGVGGPTPATPPMLGDIEGGVVAYCLNSSHGARPLDPTAFQGLQYIKTPSYVQIIGQLDITKLGFASDDSGGELDPHGADKLGNPVGGLVYSSALPSGDNSTLQQVVRWTMFYDGNLFCLKICDPTNTGGSDLCFNEYDTIGCRYNMPADYNSLPGKFEVCEGENQDRFGLYPGKDGKTTEWPRPSNEAQINAVPYTPRVPATSNCQTFASTALFAQASTAAPSATPGVSSTAGGSGSTATAGNQSASRSAPSASPTSGATSIFACVGASSMLALLAALVVV